MRRSIVLQSPVSMGHAGGTPGYALAPRSELRCTAVLYKTVESGEKASVLSFGLLRCKCHPVPIKLAAAARASSSSVVFQGCVSAFVTTQRTLIGYSLLVRTRNKMNAQDDPAALQCHFVIMNHLPFLTSLFFLFTSPLACIIL